ncbi:hypothetical protein BDQ17DRAFT_1371555 [Cyathus striatus]|nr:hypothetical protein BDQ17DRAFT_1371555 [Cyathus striatus]
MTSFVINTPFDAVACQPILITWTGGTDFDLRPDTTVYEWLVDRAPGSPVVLQITDHAEHITNSNRFEVADGGDNSCVTTSSTQAPTSTSTSSFSSAVNTSTTTSSSTSSSSQASTATSISNSPSVVNTVTSSSTTSFASTQASTASSISSSPRVVNTGTTTSSFTSSTNLTSTSTSMKSTSASASTSVSSIGTSQSSTGTNDGKSLRTAAIAGGVSGAVVALILSVLLGYICLRRRRRLEESRLEMGEEDIFAPNSGAGDAIMSTWNSTTALVPMRKTRLETNTATAGSSVLLVSGGSSATIPENEVEVVAHKDSGVRFSPGKVISHVPPAYTEG